MTTYSVNMLRYLYDADYNRELHERNMQSVRNAGARMRERVENQVLALLETCDEKPSVVILPPRPELYFDDDLPPEYVI